jgi:hypothetical protein
MTNSITPTGVSKPRGFATMSSSRRKEIASLGGQKAHENGKAHRFTSEEAREASAKAHEVMRVKREAEKTKAVSK